MKKTWIISLIIIVIMIGINILIKKIMTERDRNEDLGTVY